MWKEAFKIDFPSEIVKEGKVRVIVPKLRAFAKKSSDYAPSKAPVFYNPVMEFNRDISVLAFRAYQRLIKRDLSICDPLAGSGIRGIRYAAEISGVKKVTISDISQRASKLAKYNVELNGLQDRVEVKHKEANCLLSCHGGPRKRFDIIDVDPFGSPAPYLDAAVRALRNRGLLSATATDLAPLCGVHQNACMRKYGGKPLRTEYCHELAVRLLVGCIASIAARYDIGVHVFFCHSMDHYIRVYLQIIYGAKKADLCIKRLGFILNCYKCLHRETTRSIFNSNSRKCPECGSEMDWAGPLWLGKIFDSQFIDLMVQESKSIAFKNNYKILRLLTLAEDEAEAPETYYVIDQISRFLVLPVPSVSKVILKLRSEGFKAFLTHFHSCGVRTDASALKVQDLLKATLTNA